MSNYVLSFRGQKGRTVGADEEAEWGQWFQEIGASIVDSGHRVGRVSALGAGRADGDALAGYVVIAAGDLDAAVSLAKGCPGLRHGAGLEVGEAVDM
ncbi:MAG TPA: hypothetical protein VLL25_04735 [Acidimicrobiales bacterium]|nr:hypothetical protein [Acidimicrobiales bacterium]